MLYPLTFEPIFKERIWGGRNLERLEMSPPGTPIGELWAVSDRPGDESVVANGPLKGRTLRWIMEHQAVDLMGPLHPMPPRFPLLVKIIDAREALSIQVHPPATVAASLGGEPKTEMWYVSKADPGAEIYAGLKRGVTRAGFEKHLTAGSVEECIQRIPVKAGDAMFLPSGRIHALGANTTIFEIQQNSDTTYRVFDWNRVDAKGKGRELHVSQSLASIDFADFEPALLPDTVVADGAGTVRSLVLNKRFTVNLRTLSAGGKLELGGPMQILGVIEGSLQISSPDGMVEIGAEEFCLIPNESANALAQAQGPVSFLQAYYGLCLTT